MRASAAAAKAARRLTARPVLAGSAVRVDDGLREVLLARVRAAELTASDDGFDAEIAALEAAGECVPPSEAELAGLAPDPYAGPPDGEFAWLADLPGPLLDEYLAAVADRAVPEVLAAGLWDRSAGGGGGFGSGGVADRLVPGPGLAWLAAEALAAGLSRLNDDELIGVLLAGRRLASWSASLELAAVSDLMRRRMEQEAAGAARAAEHADAEIAVALTLTGRAAGGLLDLAMALERLPQTAQALAAGVIDVPRAMVIVGEVAGLNDEHMAAVEERVLVRAGEQTTTELRAAARRAVNVVDPSAVRKQREKAARDARVERWAEHSGTAALAGRDLPPVGALAADQHVSELAAGLRAAGAAGTMDQLRAQVFVALLVGQPVSSLLPPGATVASWSGGPSGAASGGSAPGGPSGPGAPSPGGSSSTPGSSSASSTPGSSGARGAQGGVAVAGMVNLTMPLSTWLGLSQAPGEVAGFGPLGAADSRGLGQAMAAHPQTRWCLTIVGEGGCPVAHGCLRRRRGKRGSPGGGPGPPPGAGWVTGVRLEWLESGGCLHRREVAGYRPSVVLEHLIRVRQQVCAFPGCQRAARRCDLDHTIPYDQGGRTCECNMAPLCRRHHQAKQAPGWRLDQTQPGVMAWTTPSGRTYTTSPTSYPS